MVAPRVMSDEELYQLTGSWEAAAALRDEQNNALNQYNWSQAATPAATPSAAETSATPTTPTFTEDIFTPATTEEELLTAISSPAAPTKQAAPTVSEVVAPTTPAPPAAKTSEIYLGENRWLNPATGQITRDFTRAEPVKQIVREEDRDGRHYRYYDDGSVDSSVLSTDNFLDFVGDVAPGIALKTALTMAGGPAGQELGLTLGNAVSTQLGLDLSSKAATALGTGLIRGTLAESTGGNFVTGALGGAASAAPDIPLGDTGITLGNLNTANKVLNANDAASALSALAADKTISGATSGVLDADTAKALNTGLQVNNIVTQLQAGNEGAALTLLGDLAGSSDLKTAGAAVKAIDAIQAGNITALPGLITNLSNTTGSSTKSSSASQSTTPEITTLSDEDLAELNPGELQAYQDNGVQGLADFRRSMKNLTSLTTSGRTGDDMGGGTLDDVLSTGTTTGADTTTGAGPTTGATTGATNTELDALINEITKTGPNTDSNLTNQDILDLVNAGTDTVNVTGKTTTTTPAVTSTETSTDTGTGGSNVGDDKGTVVVTGANDTCPVGTKLNPVTGNCDPYWDETGSNSTTTTTPDAGTVVVTDKKCAEGYVYDEAQQKCVPIETVTVTDKKCAEGYVYDEDLKQCVPIAGDDDACAEGFHRDDVTGLCVPNEETPTGITCPEGYELNEAGTACIPVVKVVDKKCAEGYVYDEDLKQCVPIKKTPLTCPTGFHLSADGLSCVKDTVVTPPPVVTPPVVTTPPITKKFVLPSFVPTAYVSEDKTDPIYAEGMDDFNLFATLEELMADKAAESDKKKDNKKSKEKTKMATGGHLDDLLAEQMTVDDLLKLLR